MITEAELHNYNKWLMEVWNPNQLHIPFESDAPKAYLQYKAEQLTESVIGNSNCDQIFEQASNADYEFNLHRHWNEDNRTGYDSKPIGGISNY